MEIMIEEVAAGLQQRLGKDNVGSHQGKCCRRWKSGWKCSEVSDAMIGEGVASGFHERKAEEGGDWRVSLWKSEIIMWPSFDILSDIIDWYNAVLCMAYYMRVPFLHRWLLSHFNGLDSWNAAMAQKSRLKMQTQGITKFCKTLSQFRPSCAALIEVMKLRASIFF